MTFNFLNGAIDIFLHIFFGIFQKVSRYDIITNRHL